ncbi:MAG: 1-acyl-sn-glycerol-3-phosphate acyltransferase [Actinobacteria bacterium]|nr:1-acyl-sn-glycerol-3-phosphate acyltransferase [Actinomycetota bacterium]
MEATRSDPLARRAIYGTIIAAVRLVLFGLLRWRLDVRGLEHVPRAGGAVLAFNHHSYVDFLVTCVPLYRHTRRYPVFLAKAELFRPRVRGWIFRASGQVPVERGSVEARARAFTTAVDRLREGALIAIAPEQSISQSFELLPFRTGAVRMAQAAQVPIIPAIAWGDQRFFTKRRKPHLVWRLPVTVRYVPPVHVAPDEDPVEATERLQTIMAEMLDDAIRTYPDAARPGDDWWQPARYGGSAPLHDEVVRAHLARWPEAFEPDLPQEEGDEPVIDDRPVDEPAVDEPRVQDERKRAV